jgi:hypothetical protein
VALAHEMGHFLIADSEHHDRSRTYLMHHAAGRYGGKVLTEDEILLIRETLD